MAGLAKGSHKGPAFDEGWAFWSWQWEAPLGPVVGIDCNLTKRFWAPDCTRAKVWFGGQDAELESRPH